ncbi:hypothetical protein PPYR_00228 [Photinus pyralis]|uniref:CUB domain-containing protein n=1 Tax=Photinus pyralis TaxID=7054 RepID=A0A5N4B166_PHOPY|nr:uncharacterized protein LOC116167892 [Photinus pyralis]KAB0803258.1 hypothetical protein PPYR_00228 [Photinus pyralis]
MHVNYFVIFSLIVGIECAFFDYTDVFSDDLYQYWDKNARIVNQNRECRADGDQQLVGVCKNIAECAWSGGVSRRSTTCGFLSQCCTHRQSCNGRTSAKVSYFTSNQQTANSCDYTVQLMNRNICQLRLDFVQMNLEKPNDNGQCANGSFSVVNFNNIPTICGTNNGQHMYVHITGGQPNSVTLNIQNPTVSNSWLIKVTQLYCPGTSILPLGLGQYRDMAQDFPMLAPPGCLQYNTGRTGNFSSFGYSSGDTSSKYSAGQRYTICFKNPDPVRNQCMKFVLQEFNLAQDTFLFVVGGTTPERLTGTGLTTNTFYTYPGIYSVYFQSAAPPNGIPIGQGFLISYDTSGSAPNCGSSIA